MGGKRIIINIYNICIVNLTNFFLFSVMGVWDKVIQSEEVQGVNGQVTYTQNSVNYGYLFLLLLSYFFTHQVIQNTTHVTVAGTVGSWCTFIL